MAIYEVFCLEPLVELFNYLLLFGESPLFSSSSTRPIPRRNIGELPRCVADLVADQAKCHFRAANPRCRRFSGLRINIFIVNVQRQLESLESRKSTDEDGGIGKSIKYGAVHEAYNRLTQGILRLKSRA